MRNAIFLLVLLAVFSAAQAEQPLLLIGGDGHAYAIGPGSALLHIHHGRKREISVPEVSQVFRGHTGVIVTTKDQVIWVVERGEPTEIASGAVADVAEAPDGTYISVWHQGSMSIIFVP